jgi:spermidine synthase
VLEAGKLYFTSEESLAALDRWQLHVDDGRHFLRESREFYDLIIVDVPSPLTIQEAHLHTMEFYALAKQRLTDTGVLAVQLSGPLQHNDRTPARVAAALSQVFREVLAINSDRADRGFAYASQDLPFNGRQLREAAHDYEQNLELIRPAQIQGFIEDAVPLSTDRMDIVLRRGWARFFDRYLRG